jgi:hypothetical protein
MPTPARRSSPSRSAESRRTAAAARTSSRSTGRGVSARPLQDAADAFLASLGPEQRARALFSLDSDAWRRWSNIHLFVMRHGVCLDEMSLAQRERALALLRESLSAGGFQTARDVMRLNEFVRTLTGSDVE